MEWFRCYSEFATDSKVQIMPEYMQRRLIMLFCLRSCNALATLHATEIAFALRITEEELIETKTLFIQKEFIDDDWNIQNWDKRQYISDTSTERSRKHRDKKKYSLQQVCNVAATPPEQNRTDTEQNKKEQREPLSIFKNKILNEEMKKYAESKGIFGERLEKSWQKFLIKKGNAMIEKKCSYEQFFAEWQLWILDERIEGPSPKEGAALVGEELLAQQLGTVVWLRDRKMFISAQQEKAFLDFETRTGIKVTWRNAREWREQGGVKLCQ